MTHRISGRLAYPLPEAWKEEIASLENITVLHYYRAFQIDVPDPNGHPVRKFLEPDGCVLVQPSFFEVFDFAETEFKWIAGDSKTALDDPFSIVLTRSIAEKYFGSLDVIGKTLRVEQQMDFKVTGVIEDLPRNTDFPFKVFLSYATFYMIQGNEMKNDWRSVANVNQCFMTLPKGVDKEAVEKQVDRIHAAHVPGDVARRMTFQLQPLKEMHQDNRFGTFNMRTVNKTMLWTLALAGIVLLVIACINYVNLATAQSTLRSKEIGIRKVLGSKRRQLVFQFLSEAFLVALFASILSLLAAQLIITQLESLINMHVDYYLFFDWFVIRALLAMLFMITVCAGFYPAMIVSGFEPVNAIKSKLAAPGSGAHLRKTLVVFQFTLTQIFIIGTFVVVNQMHYFRNVDLGFEKEGIMHVRLPNDYQRRIETLPAQLQSIAEVSDVSISSTIPSGLRRALWTTGIRRKEADPGDGIACEYQAIDANYIDLYGIEMVAGRNFLPGDSAGYLIMNLTLTQAVGFVTPEEALGREMVMDGKPYTVIGVASDFQSRSLKEGLDKVAFAVHPHMYRLVNIKFNLPPDIGGPSGLLQSTISKIESVWATRFPETVFEYGFLDENIAAYYAQETKMSKLLQIFSAVLLVIGCLGLYGLISFVINRRLKEVAVRKVFGASMLHIMGLISRDYLKLILIAFIIAVPVSVYYLEKWLNSYANRIAISWWVLILPGLIVLAIALMAVSGQLLRAAKANPADTLRSE